MNIFNQIKKSVASFTLGALLFGFVTPVANAQLGFVDDAEIPSWAFEAIDELMAQGVISGNDDGSFAPNRQLNRAEVSKIIVLATGVDLDVTGGPNFPDVQPDAWYYDYVETMYNNGWINGYPDGMFRPEVGINRAEIAKMVVNAFELDPDTSGAPHFDDFSSNDWFFTYVETAYNYGLMRGYGDGTFGPADPVTRAQTVKIVYDAQLVVTGFTGVAAGTLEVTLSSDTPRGTNIPYNATSVPFTTLEMTASDDSAVEISSITFTRLGLGDNDDFDNVWLEIDGFKVGNDKSVNNDDVVELRFNPPVVIPAGQTVVADVVASMDYQLNADGTCFGIGADGCNIGHNNRFALVSADDIVSSAANIVGPFPIEGEEMQIANYQVTQTEFQVLGSDTTVDVGDNFIEIGKYRMLNKSNTNKDIELRAITFKNDGSGDVDQILENVALYVSGEQVSAETIIDGDYVTFRLDNGVTGGYILEDGDSRIFSIRADIVSAEKGDTINFKVDNFEDIVGIEIGTSFGVKAVSRTKTSLATGATPGTTDSSLTVDASAEDDNARLRLYTIDTGDLNVSRDPSSLGNQQYAPGSNDVVFLTARVVVDQPLIVDGVKVRVNNSVAITDLAQLNRNFDNFRLFMNDRLIDTENEFRDEDGVTTVLTGDYLNFNTTFEIAGTSVLKVVGNLQDDVPTGASLSLSLSAKDFASPEYISTGDQVETNQLLGSAAASAVEIEVSQVTISKSDGLSDNDEIVAGVDDITLMEFTLSNNDSGDINVTSVSIQGQAAGAPAANFSNFTAAIFVDGIQQGSSRNLDSTTGKATFNDVSVVIPTSAQKEFAVVVDTIEAIADSNPASTNVVTGIGVAVVAGAAVTAVDTAEVAAGSTVINIAAPGLTAALSAGDEIVISTDGTPTASGAEIRTVAQDYAAGENVVVVTEPFSNGHIGTAEEMSLVTRQYPIGTTTFSVASTANIEVGDSLTVGGNTCVVAAVDTVAKRVTCTIAFVAAVPVGTAVTEPTTGDSFAINVIAIDADNVENGQKVEVIEGGVELGEGITDPAVATTSNGNCTGLASTNNFLCGAKFLVLESGTLFVESENLTPSTRILVAGTEQVEVLRLRLTANDDDVEIKDFYFIQDTATVPALVGPANVTERLDFSLRTSSGALIQERNMVNGKLHFELSNANRIRVPKDDSINVSVFADVRAITTMAQTGQQLRLAIDTAAETNGFEASTVATGRDLTAGAANAAAEKAIDETFVIYKTAIKFDTATSQPTLVEGGAGQALPVYRFTVTADAAGDATLEKFSTIITPVGLEIDGVVGGFDAGELVVYRCSSTDCSNATLTGAVQTQAGNVSSFEFATSQNIQKGTSVTFEIRSNVSIADGDLNNTTGEQFTVTFPKDAVYVAPSTAARAAALVALAAQNIVWSDRSNSGNAGAFIGGYELTVPDSANLVGASR